MLTTVLVALRIGSTVCPTNKIRDIKTKDDINVNTNTARSVSSTCLRLICKCIVSDVECLYRISVVYVLLEPRE